MKLARLDYQNQKIIWPKWYYTVPVTRYALENNSHVIYVPNYYRRVTFIYDMDCWIYAHWTLAPIYKLYYLWKQNRWYIEHKLSTYGIIYTYPDGGYFNAAKMNWDWRWYDKETWIPKEFKK